MGQTEPRVPLYEYPDYDYEPTAEITNFEPPDAEQAIAGAEPVSGPAVKQAY